MIKQLHTNESLVIDFDLCQPHYQVLLILFLKFTTKSLKNVQKEKKIKSVCDFVGLKNNKLPYKSNERKKQVIKTNTFTNY